MNSLNMLFLFCYNLHFYLATGNKQSADLQAHLQKANQCLETRQYSDALTQLNAAIDIDDKDHLIYYKRALTYLAMGKNKQAINDLNRIIELNFDFTPAPVLRGEIYFKQGELEKAHIDFEHVLRRDQSNEKIIQLYSSIEHVYRIREDIQHAVDMEDYATSLSYLNDLLELTPWDLTFRKLRSEVHFKSGDVQMAILDLKFGLKLITNDLEGIYRLSTLYYQVGNVKDSLSEIRECLKYSPEDKLCFDFYKKLKKLSKLLDNAEEYTEKGEYSEATSELKKALKLESVQPLEIQFSIYHKLCLNYLKLNNGQLSTMYCTKGIELKEDENILCDRAEGYILDDLFQEAIADYQRSNEINENSRARDGLSKAQKLLKQSKKRDYYKILGVPRSANKKQIIKAYRKLAQKFHPDNFQGETEEKKQATQKFLDIAAAKEVLTDEQKRAKFDQGEDPLDPEQDHHGSPFQHFHHNPFSGGGFTFHFQ